MWLVDAMIEKMEDKKKWRTCEGLSRKSGTARPLNRPRICRESLATRTTSAMTSTKARKKYMVYLRS